VVSKADVHWCALFGIVEAETGLAGSSRSTKQLSAAWYELTYHGVASGDMVPWSCFISTFRLKKGTNASDTDCRRIHCAARQLSANGVSRSNGSNLVIQHAQ
jgi:hypothetical protein